MKELPRFLTTEEVAKLLSVAPKTIRNWVYQKKIPSIKINNGLVRYRLGDILEWVHNSTS